ncbi:MAG: hypothetical protein R2706_10490 [Acidimicrobiales bacterium]
MTEMRQPRDRRTHRPLHRHRHRIAGGARRAGQRGRSGGYGFAYLGDRRKRLTEFTYALDLVPIAEAVEGDAVYTQGSHGELTVIIPPTRSTCGDPRSTFWPLDQRRPRHSQSQPP